MRESGNATHGMCRSAFELFRKHRVPLGRRKQFFEQLEALAAEVGDVDVLFNGAGYVHAGTILESFEEEWDFAFNLNVRSQYRLARAFLPGMLAKGQGSIINVASIAGRIPLPYEATYSATKFGLRAFTFALAAR